MKTRRIYLQPEEILELLDTESNSVLKCRILRGAQGNLHVLAYSQPGSRIELDLPPQYLPEYLAEDPADIDWVEPN